MVTKELVTVDPAILKPYGGNPRHNNKSAQMVAESIKQYGYINPIVIDENNVILAEARKEHPEWPDDIDFNVISKHAILWAFARAKVRTYFYDSYQVD